VNVLLDTAVFIARESGRPLAALPEGAVSRLGHHGRPVRHFAADGSGDYYHLPPSARLPRRGQSSGKCGEALFG